MTAGNSVKPSEDQREFALTMPAVQAFQRACLHGLRGSNIDPAVVMVTLSMQGVFIGALQKLLVQYSADGKPITMADIHRANRAAMEAATLELDRPLLRVASGLPERQN
jgi:hypothetical protein